MQYLLTKEELDNLVPKEKLESALDNIETLNKKVLELSEHKCIHITGHGYCDWCPIGGFGTRTCNKSKTYSK